MLKIAFDLSKTHTTIFTQTFKIGICDSEISHKVKIATFEVFV